MKAWIARDEVASKNWGHTAWLYFDKPVRSDHGHFFMNSGGNGWLVLPTTLGLKPGELRRVNISIKPVKK